MLTVSFETDNDAFQGADREEAVATTLESIAERIRSGALTGKVKDINGNTVGLFDLKADS